MKKVLVVLAVLAASAASTYAVNPDDTAVFYKLTNKTVFNGLTRYLGTNSEQNEYLKSVFESTENMMKNAETKSDDTAYYKAVTFNLANVKYLLTHEQYRKYLIMLNLTLANNAYPMFVQEK